MGGLDLSRCGPGSCPAEAEGLACPRDTRNHPFYCLHLRRDPAAWAPAIVASAREDLRAAAGGPPAWRAKLDAERAEYLALPAPVREAARDCPLRRVEPRPSGCGGCGGEASVCRGGPRDGEAVAVIDCARCQASNPEPAR
jgi:hypothetical protein